LAFRAKQKAATALKHDRQLRKCGLSAFRSSNDYPRPFAEHGGSSPLVRSLSEWLLFQVCSERLNFLLLLCGSHFLLRAQLI
jgi:hypothetical protein